ncbi:DNA polymerase [Caenispirillum bisanense]|uniref:DNA polymerase I - 3'-5' exonuclease and polymerase domains n=1 Tax=Caenispirillum bisanense TaxID=414052 RepID=A0A286H204_9PROT|nr:DNA polymerase [Caenispirillum bisanense]SOE01787.1 DNA polymerase I - 3'-5' exonuclease and polymerase domains [Caenispirillum bisanense]
MMDALPFKEVWAVDFEFIAGEGRTPSPVCLVAREIKSGRLVRLWHDEFGQEPPYAVDADALFVAYYASAEVGCHLALGWPPPERVLDLFTEFRARTNGTAATAGNGLLGALTHFGLDSIGAVEKEGMRDLILSGGPWDDDDKAAILDYCQSDVDALARLLPVMVSKIDLPRALLRGRYMTAAARIEATGIPIDVPTLKAMQEHWRDIQALLIEEIDASYGVFDGTTFKHDRFASYLIARGINWPRTETGRLAVSDDIFREQAKVYPVLEPLRQLRSMLGQMRLSDLTVGPDGRNRTMLSAFRSKTGRNQPSNSRFIFGASRWLRGLVRPEPGRALAYVDWSQQEVGIAAALSGDAAMAAAYTSGDPYLAFAVQAGAAPEGATKATHKDVRDLYKATVLAVQYGMGEESLARRIAQPEIMARQLLRKHRDVYAAFWKWSDAVVAHAMTCGWLSTVYGWPLHVGKAANERMLRNFPMQANGAEMLRIACCLATERGIEVCAPVHDALLIEASSAEIDAVVKETQAAMAEASRFVLDGFELATDAKVVRYPDRFMEDGGTEMWGRVSTILNRLDAQCTKKDLAHA